MITFENSKGNEIKIFGDICEDEALAQIKKLADFEPYLDSHIRIMPDVHAGKGCTVGTTMILDKTVTPNLVGVDIGCGMFVVPLGKVDIDLAKFDKVVNEKIPCGFNIHDQKQRTFQKLNDLYCRINIDLDMAQRSIGSLGGGNHFIELDIDDSGNKYLVIHSGSRNLGVKVCGYYQCIAKRNCDPKRENRAQIIAILKARGREKEIQATLKAMRHQVDKDLAYLQGADMCNYLHDMIIAQDYAKFNRETIAGLILIEFSDIIGKTDERPFHTIHNYIEFENSNMQTVLRKGAVSAYLGERLIIPMNMRDGSLLCIGKGTFDWNYSAPHGAGRLMSRNKAKQTLSMADFEKSMDGIYSTSVCESTIDEAPQAYKPTQSIIDAISGTVTIEKIIRPIYNFKAKQ